VRRAAVFSGAFALTLMHGGPAELFAYVCLLSFITT
jgi:hypothetical protein